MRLLNLFLFLIALFTFSDKSFSLTDYQIKKICKKEERELNFQQKINEISIKFNFIYICFVIS